MQTLDLVSPISSTREMLPATTRPASLHCSRIHLVCIPRVHHHLGNKKRRSSLGAQHALLTEPRLSSGFWVPGSFSQITEPPLLTPHDEPSLLLMIAQTPHPLKSLRWSSTCI